LNESEFDRLIRALNLKPKPASSLADLAFPNVFGPRTAIPLSGQTNPFDFRPPPPAISQTRLGSITPAPAAIPEVKRKVYFAFTFSDILRVNNVRQIGKIGPRESRNARTFFDRSIWERRSIRNDEGLKNLMRNGVKHSSAVCVLIGTDTWDSRWVK
jgi:hypothetical protein